MFLKQGGLGSPRDLDTLEETQIIIKKFTNPELMSQVSEPKLSGILRGEGVSTQWVTQKDKPPGWTEGLAKSLCPLCFLSIALWLVASPFGGLA